MISQFYNESTIKQGIFKDIFPENIQYGKWEVVKIPRQPYVKLQYRNKKESVCSDSSVYIIEYFKDIYNRSFNSILIAGLGIGTLSYLCQDFCNTIDVVESDDELITLITQKGHLNNKVNIINDDIFNFTTDKKYDVICLNIWLSDKPDDFENQITTLRSHFANNLNENGIIHIPIIDYYNSTCYQ